MLKYFTLFLFRICGWKVHGEMPQNIKKSIVVAGPHTSNFDFLFAMAGFYSLKLPVKYLLKKEWLDNFFLSKIFNNSGALGVDRNKNNSMVDAIADLITSHEDNLHIMISPEGTRKLTHRWKTGFYYAALKAKVPLVLSSLDYSKKLAHIGPVIMPTGCFKRDMIIVKEYYQIPVPKYPDQFSLQIYEPDHDAICAG